MGVRVPCLRAAQLAAPFVLTPNLAARFCLLSSHLTRGMSGEPIILAGGTWSIGSHARSTNWRLVRVLS
jgi:hypothetical protein